jgi:hypothetical protein
VQAVKLLRLTDLLQLLQVLVQLTEQYLNNYDYYI